MSFSDTAVLAEAPGGETSLKNRSTLFLIFKRLHAQEHYNGSGRGWALCRKIEERHGGRIRVESEPGQGSRIHFTLPAREGDGNGRING